MARPLLYTVCTIINLVAVILFLYLTLGEILRTTTIWSTTDIIATVILLVCTTVYIIDDILGLRLAWKVTRIRQSGKSLRISLRVFFVLLCLIQLIMGIVIYFFCTTLTAGNSAMTETYPSGWYLAFFTIITLFLSAAAQMILVFPMLRLSQYTNDMETDVVELGTEIN